MKRILLTAIILTAGLLPLQGETGYYTPEAVLGFADWLVEQGDYERAAGEYLRAIFLDETCYNAEILLKTGNAYRLAGDYGKARQAYETLEKDFPDSSLVDRLPFLEALTYYNEAAYGEALELLRLEEHTTEEALLLEGAIYLMQKNWEQAAGFMAESFPVPGTGTTALRLSEIADRALHLKRKSPLLAGILSTAIPGTGKIYAGAPGDGLFSLAAVSLFGGLAAYSFYSKGVTSAEGWIYGILGGIYYLGNIYGSAVAAERYNDIMEQAVLRDVQITADTFVR